MSWIAPSFDDDDDNGRPTKRTKRASTASGSRSRPAGRSRSSPIRKPARPQVGFDCGSDNGITDKMLLELGEFDLTCLIEEEDDGQAGQPSGTAAAAPPVLTRPPPPPPLERPLDRLDPAQMEQLPWTDKYKPSRLEDLRSVNPTKLAELEAWCEQVYQRDEAYGSLGKSQPNQQKLLLLSGPAGCGKTLALQLICDRLRVETLEFSVEAGDKSNFEAGWQDRTSEWARSARQTESQFTQFCRFVMGANGTFQQAGKRPQRLLLIKELPTSLTTHTRQYHEFLERYLNQVPDCVPVVFVFTHELGSTELRDRLFAKPVQASLHMKNLEFNAVGKRALAQVLNCIMDNRLSKQFVDSVIDACDGDLRNAINMLELSFKHIHTERPAEQLPKTVRRRKELSLDQLHNISACFGGKDQAPMFFHFLGKVLYCKRIPLRTLAGSAEQLPASMVDRQRLPLKENPEQLLDQMHDQCDNMGLFLHQNYKSFMEDDIRQAARCASWLSLVDADFSARESWSATHLQEYHKILTLRGVMFNLPSSTRANRPQAASHADAGKSKFLAFEKPAFFEQRRRQAAVQQLVQGFSAFQLDVRAPDKTELMLDRLPAMLRMNRQPLRTQALAEQLPACYPQFTGSTSKQSSSSSLGLSPSPACLPPAPGESQPALTGDFFDDHPQIDEDSD